MKRYVIEREIPGASELSQDELVEIAGKSNGVVESLGVPYTVDHQLRRGRQDLLRARGRRRRRHPRARSPRRVSGQQHLGHRQRVRAPHRRIGRRALTVGTSRCALTRQHRDALDVVGQRERVEHPHGLHLVPVRQVEAHVAGE